jgi:hypothetical protein
VPDGTYKVLGDAVTAMLAPGWSADNLEKLAQLLRQQITTGASASALAAQIQHQIPAFTRLSEVLERHPAVTNVLVGLLSIAVTLILNAYRPSDATNNVTNNNTNNVTLNQQHIVEQAITQYMAQLPKAAPYCEEHHTHHHAAHQQRPARAAAKQGRNERCACNSGKKYKHCCGSLTAPTGPP